MTSPKEKKANKIILWIAFPVVIVAIILSLTGIVPLPPSTTFIGIAVLLIALIAAVKPSKNKK